MTPESGLLVRQQPGVVAVSLSATALVIRLRGFFAGCDIPRRPVANVATPGQPSSLVSIKPEMTRPADRPPATPGSRRSHRSHPGRSV